MTAYGTARTMNDKTDPCRRLVAQRAARRGGAPALGAGALAPTADAVTFVKGADTRCGTSF